MVPRLITIPSPLSRAYEYAMCVAADFFDGDQDQSVRGDALL